MPSAKGAHRARCVRQTQVPISAESRSVLARMITVTSFPMVTEFGPMAFTRQRQTQDQQFVGIRDARHHLAVQASDDLPRRNATYPIAVSLVSPSVVASPRSHRSVGQCTAVVEGRISDAILR